MTIHYPNASKLVWKYFPASTLLVFDNQIRRIRLLQSARRALRIISLSTLGILVAPQYQKKKKTTNKKTNRKKKNSFLRCRWAWLDSCALSWYIRAEDIFTFCYKPWTVSSPIRNPHIRGRATQNPVRQSIRSRNAIIDVHSKQLVLEHSGHNTASNQVNTFLGI